MKRSILTCLFPLLILGSGSLFAQVELRVNGGGGLFLIPRDMDEHQPGFRIQAGLSAEGAVPYLRDLTWEVGSDIAYTRSGQFQLKHEQTEGIEKVEDITEIFVIDGNYPIDRSRRFIHTFGFLDVPFRLRYNAFGFMGITAGMNLSFTLKEKISGHEDYPLRRIYQFDGNMISHFNVGLFFPLSDRLSLDLEGQIPRKFRFYVYESTWPNGDKSYHNPFYDYSIIAKISYRLIGDKSAPWRK